MMPRSLFDRLPLGLFRPLAAGTTAERNWQLLVALFEQAWAPGLAAPGEEIEKSRVVRLIEGQLILMGSVADAEDEAPDTPIAIRANDAYLYLRDAGWLTERRRGVRFMVTVRPVVAQFFDVLADFAERGPEFLGSKVQSIQANLRLAVDNTDGGALREAAQQCQRLLSHIANTGVQVFDLMEKLQKVGSVREFVQGFFENYIEKLFIADYLAIRTENHPLRHRAQIVSDAARCEHVEALSVPLIEWYTARLAGGDADRGRRLFQRDTATLRRLSDIENHLARLDAEIRSANQRALIYLEYKVRAPRSFDQLLVRACRGAAALTEDHIGLPAAAPLEPLSEQWVARPPSPSAAAVGSDLRREPPTLEARALDSLRKQMAASRRVTPLAVATYVARHLGRQDSTSSDALTIDSVLDLCCYQRLLLIASRQQASSDDARHDPFATMVPGLRIRFGDGFTDNAFMRHRRFHLQRVHAR